MTNVDVFNQVPFLEQDALRAISQEDLTTFERYIASLHYVFIYSRRVVQLKAVYQNNANLVPSESTHKAIGLYLLYLLASDRIGMIDILLHNHLLTIADFHTLLESLSTHEQGNQYIKYPVQLERYIMEGNFAKVLVEQRDRIFDILFQRLEGVVQLKQQQNRTECATSSGLPSGPALTAVDQTAAMGILSNMIGYATDLERIV